MRIKQNNYLGGLSWNILREYENINEVGTYLPKKKIYLLLWAEIEKCTLFGFNIKCE